MAGSSPAMTGLGRGEADAAIQTAGAVLDCFAGARNDERKKVLVVIAAGEDFERLGFAFAGHAIDEAVFAGDAAGPPARKVSLQWFRFADAFEGRTFNRID